MDENHHKNELYWTTANRCKQVAENQELKSKLKSENRKNEQIKSAEKKCDVSSSCGHDTQMVHCTDSIHIVP